MNIKIPVEIRFNKQGLIPAVVQEAASGTVLMLAYMDREALAKTLASGEMWYYSRSRNKLWHKGAVSGHYQYVVDASYDCDADALLFKVHQVGVACHRGPFSCFHHDLPFVASKLLPTSYGEQEGQALVGRVQKANFELGNILTTVFEVIKKRQAARPKDSYTGYLFNEGQDKILKKVGEEAAETIIASKNNICGELLYELGDLYYHTLVLLAYHGLEPGQLAAELAHRLPRENRGELSDS